MCYFLLQHMTVAMLHQFICYTYCIFSIGNKFKNCSLQKKKKKKRLFHVIFNHFFNQISVFLYFYLYLTTRRDHLKACWYIIYSISVRQSILLTDRNTSAPICPLCRTGILQPWYWVWDQHFSISLFIFSAQFSENISSNTLKWLAQIMYPENQEELCEGRVEGGLCPDVDCV